MTSVAGLSPIAPSPCAVLQFHYYLNLVIETKVKIGSSGLRAIVHSAIRNSNLI